MVIIDRKLIRTNEGVVRVEEYSRVVDDDMILRRDNEQTLRRSLATAFPLNRTFIAAVKPSTAAAQASAAYDQAVRQARQLNALILLAGDEFNDISGI